MLPTIMNRIIWFLQEILYLARGCGRLFEGTIHQLYSSLQRLKSLPNDTQIYCGHEYTVGNLRFAQWLEPDNDDVQRALSIVYSHTLLNKNLRCLLFYQSSIM